MNEKNCPVCGRPLSTLDILLAEHDRSFQCRNCWNRVHVNGSASRKFAAPARPVHGKTVRRLIRHPEKKS